MPQPFKKIVVLTSGGDAPGMNAAIRGVVRTAIYYGLEVYASEMGFQGLVDQKLRPLDARAVANCIQRGGTLLKTARCKAFFDPTIRAHCRDFLNKKSIDGIIVIGGDGSFQGAHLLHQEGGPPVVGIPCTIDNDIQGSEYCIGFDTARNTALAAIDKIRDTAFSLERNFLIEVMGRTSGFIAVEVGIAGGAEIILTPEFPMSLDELTAKILQQNRQKKMVSIIVAAEAGSPGHCFQLAQRIKEKIDVEYKVCILGHTQRGGTPTAYDRVIASLMGAKAVQALLDGQTEVMMAVQNNQVVAWTFPKLQHPTRFFNLPEWLQINNMLCR